MGLASMKLAARRPKRDVKVGLEKDDVIAALYSAAMGREEWPAALDKLAELTATRCVTIDTYDLSARVGTVLASNIAPHQAVEPQRCIKFRARIALLPGIAAFPRSVLALPILT